MSTKQAEGVRAMRSTGVMAMAAALSMTAALIFNVGSAGHADAQTPLKKVRVAAPSDWTPTEPAPLYGKKLGFFADEGIDVEFVTLQGAAVLLPQVANKSVDVGYSSLDLLLLAIDKGEPYPIKAFFNVQRSNPFEFVVPENSPVKTLADLKGKTLGVGALSWGNIPMSRIMLADSGVKWMDDVKVVPVGLGPTAWRRLTSGEVDALNLFAGNHNQLAACGVAIRRLPVPPRFAGLFGNGLVANADAIKADPDLYARFGRAWAKSTYACIQNTAACVRAFWDYSAASKPAADQEAAWVQRNVGLVKAAEHLQTDGMKGDRWADFDPKQWENLRGLMVEGGLIKNPAIDVTQAYTLQFVDKINDWKRDDVKARAK